MIQTPQPISYQRSGSLHEENEDDKNTEERRPVLASSSTSSSPPRRKSSIVQVIHRAFSIGNESIQQLPDWESERQAICMRKCITAFLLICSLALPIAIWGRVAQSRGHRSQSDHTTMIDANNFCVEDPFAPLAKDFVLMNLSNGAVATDHPLCSQMGLSILKDGGNAIDASVTVALCLGVSNPASSGLGGGAFMLIHADPPREDKDTLPEFIDARNPREGPATQYASGKISEVIDCRETAPAAAAQEMFEDQPDWASAIGPLSIAVPGELRGLELAHARHGILSWEHVVQPVVELAQQGVPINPNLAHEIDIMATIYKQEKIPEIDPHLRSILTKSNDWNDPLKEGDLLFNHPLTKTLLLVQKMGADALYSGSAAEDLANDIQRVGGILTKRDLESYRAVLRSPVVGRNIAGTAMVGVPPPSSGGATVIGAARFLAGFHDPLATFADTLSVHRKVEACKHAFAIRMSLSDPAFNTDTVKDAVKDLVETDYIDALRLSHMDNTTLPLSAYGGAKWSQLKDSDGAKNASDAQEGDRRKRRLRGRPFGYLNDNGTSHFSIVDKDGNAVSMTTSVNAYFGSNIYSPSTGVLLGDTMDDFANPGRANFFGLRPSEANYIAPGKRPLSSMAPTMVFRESTDGNALGDLMLCTGASGGPKIISAVAGIFVNHIMLGMPLFEAVLSPRVHDQLIYHGSASTTIENDPLEGGPRIIVSNRTRRALERRGHRLIDVDYEGTVQAVSIDLETKLMTAVCDVRKGGSPAGY